MYVCIYIYRYIYISLYIYIYDMHMINYYLTTLLQYYNL